MATSLYSPIFLFLISKHHVAINKIMAIPITVKFNNAILLESTIFNTTNIFTPIQ